MGLDGGWLVWLQPRLDMVCRVARRGHKAWRTEVRACSWWGGPPCACSEFARDGLFLTVARNGAAAGPWYGATGCDVARCDPATEHCTTCSITGAVISIGAIRDDSRTTDAVYLVYTCGTRIGLHVTSARPRGKRPLVVRGGWSKFGHAHTTLDVYKGESLGRVLGS